MSDYMLLEYLRNKGMRGDERKLIEEFKHYMRSKGGMRRSRMNRSNSWDSDYRHDWDRDYNDFYNTKYSKDIEHFDEFEAKEIVSEMCHRELNNKIVGEHFDMRKAEEVYKKYKDHFMIEGSPEDVYIAINATYHDFHNVLKTWFGSNTDEKIIMLAVAFWFKDEDYKGNKVMDYFM